MFYVAIFEVERLMISWKSDNLAASFRRLVDK